MGGCLARSLAQQEAFCSVRSPEVCVRPATLSPRTKSVDSVPSVFVFSATWLASRPAGGLPKTLNCRPFLVWVAPKCETVVNLRGWGRVGMQKLVTVSRSGALGAPKCETVVNLGGWRRVGVQKLATVSRSGTLGAPKCETVVNLGGWRRVGS